MLTFATPQALFDRDFPGHYLRLIKRVELSVIALLPPERGVRATLSASGVSRTVVARGPFETVTLRREPETIAFTSPIDATGLFDARARDGAAAAVRGDGRRHGLAAGAAQGGQPVRLPHHRRRAAHHRVHRAGQPRLPASR